MPVLSTETSSFQNLPNPSVAAGTSAVTQRKNAYTPPNIESISVPSAATNRTSHLLGNVTLDRQLPNKRPTSRSSIIPHYDFIKDLIPRPSPPQRLRTHEMIFSHIETPYNADTFGFYLKKHNLTDTYPFLMRNLCNGFPMGEFLPLKESVIFLNHPLCLKYDKQILIYLQEEVTAQRMHGPFSQEEMEDIMKGPFQSSPIIIDIQPQLDGAPDKLRMCRHLSKHDRFHPSTNDFVDSSKFPTSFGSVSKVADIVSPSLFFLHAACMLPERLPLDVPNVCSLRARPFQCAACPLPGSSFLF
jgi:hypothetical protein